MITVKRNDEVNIMQIFDSVSELIGNTPLLRLRGVEAAYGLVRPLLGKLECQNPAGSAKDRVAREMILSAEARRLLSPGATIVEPTSGNTGIGLASVAVSRGYRVILTMPESMSLERRKLLSAFGAEIVLTPAAEGMQGAVREAERIASEKGAFLPSQFDNPDNPAAHYKTTGPEIYRDTNGTLAAFVATVGTGGTLSGVGRYLKERNARIRIVAVEPSESPLLSGGCAVPHGIQGIGANFVPDNFQREVCDEILTVSTDEAMATARALAKSDGVLVGISSGAALAAAIALAKRMGEGEEPIVALLPDTGERYLSSGLFDK